VTSRAATLGRPGADAESAFFPPKTCNRGARDMNDAPKRSRPWVRLLLIAVVLILAALALLIVTDGGGLFDYDTF